MSGVALAQGVFVFFAPVLTRLYHPEDFAAYAVFTALAGLLSVVIGGRYELAIMLPKQELGACHVAALAVFLSMISAGTILAAALLFQDHLGELRVFGDLGAVRNFVPMGSLVYVWSDVVTRWQARQQRFGRLARAEVAAAVATLSLQIGLILALGQHAAAILIGSHLIGRAVVVGLCGADLLADIRPVLGHMSKGRFAWAAKRFWRFPAYSSPAGLLSKGATAAPRLLLAGLFPLHILGFFSLSARIISLPMTFVGQAFSDVFFTRISTIRHADPGRARGVILRSSRVLFLLGLLPALILLLWGEPLFAAVFGQEWAIAGRYARLLTPMLVAQFVVAPLGLSMQVFGKQLANFIWQLGFLSVSVVSIVAGSLVGSAEAAVLCFSLSASLMYVLYFFLIIRQTDSIRGT
jgi:O-antigen/teichoic acid export membrane protein